MNIAVLWPSLNGYMNACLQSLVEHHDISLFVAYKQVDTVQAPYAQNQFGWINNSYCYSQAPDAQELLQRLEAFRPDALLINSWHIPAFRQAAQRFRRRAVRILHMDNPWYGTAKQRFGALASPWYIQPYYEGVFLMGERQAVFAHRLGFNERNIRRGAYSCDHAAFAPIYRARTSSDLPEAFLYTGRLVQEKAIDVLLAAYQQYRTLVSTPWPLIICGVGPYRSTLEGVAGVDYRGFVQPDDLPEIFGQASCFVLPSREEHWGVVIHEATAAGLAVICTDVCGASVHLVQDGFNGYLVDTEDVQGLARKLQRYSDLFPAARQNMSNNSYALSHQFTPQLWANQVIDFVNELSQVIPPD